MSETVRNASLAPEGAPLYAALDAIDGESGFTLLPVFSGAEFLKNVNYPVIVEMWKKKDTFRNRKRWEAEFTKEERKRIAQYHVRFRKWHLSSGTPLKMSCRLATLTLLQRAVAFFAECG